MSFRAYFCPSLPVICLLLLPLFGSQAQNDGQQVAVGNISAPSSHVIHFEGVKHDYRTPEEAKQALTLNLKKITSHDVMVDSLDETSASWHSNNITDCDSPAMRALLDTIQTNDGFTRRFKMFLTERFKPPKQIRVDWAGYCRKRDRDTFDPISTEPAFTTITPEPSSPTTLATTVLPATQPTTTNDSSTETSSTLDPFLSADLEFSVSMDTDLPKITPFQELNASMPALSSVDATSGQSNSTVAPEPVTVKPTNTSTESTTTVTEPSSNVPKLDESDSTTTTSSVIEEAKNKMTMSNLESGSQDPSIPNPTESIAQSDAVSAADGPHYGKYIGLSAGFLMVVAYLVVGRAHGRRAMYDLA